MMKMFQFRSLIIFTLLFFGLQLNAQISVEDANQMTETLVDDQVVVGLIGACSINGAIVWEHNAGFSNETEKVAFSNQTITRMASIAKPMTAIAVMQLVESGKIELNDPIQIYLPNFPKMPGNVMTVRHLLSHTSGLKGYASPKEAQNKEYYPNLAAALEVFADRDLEFEPGTAFYYTTYGYVVLGRLIEVVTGESYESYMKANVFERAGMQNTGVEKVGESYENKASLYHNKKGKIKAGKQNDLSNRIPGGGFYTTLEDLMKFGQAIIDHKLVTAETLALMTTDQSLGKDGNPYGFGWFLYGQEGSEASAFGHSGEQTGCASQIFIIPSQKKVVAVLSNTSGTWEEIIGLAAQIISLK